MSSHAEKMERLRQSLVKRPLERKWYVKKREQAAYSRYRVMIVLYEEKQPLTANQVCFKLGQSWESVRRYLLVLHDNNIVCDDVDCLDGERYYTICPVCPIKDKCEHKLDFWVKSGLMEPNLSPSEEFLEEKKEV